MRIDQSHNPSASSKQRGFTVIEVMVSTVVFTIVLMGAMAALIQISRIYYRGVYASRTQEVTRNIMGEISQSLQFSNKAVEVKSPGNAGPFVGDTDATGRGFFCIGPRQYSYTLDRKLTNDVGPKNSDHVLWVSDPVGGECNAASTPLLNLDQDDPCESGSKCSNGRELLGENMRLSRMNISSTSINGIRQIDIAVAYGDDDLLKVDNSDPLLPRYACNGSLFGSEFCATSELSTTVTNRFKE